MPGLYAALLLPVSVSMARTDRLFRLLHALRALPAPVTAERLAAETEVSPRSVYRDIAALRAAGARIEGAAGYGYALQEDPALPPQSFARIEIEALLIGLALAGNTGDTEVAAAAATARAKIIATLPERQSREAAHAISYVSRAATLPAPAATLAMIREASWAEEALDLAYRSEDGRSTARRVLPLTIGYIEGRLILLAWCQLRQDWRTFRIDRIEGLSRSGESFRPRRVALLNGFVRKMEAGTPPA